MSSYTLFVLGPLLVGFIITFLVEIGIIFLFFKKTVSSKKIFLVVLLVNLFTWPLINAFGSRYSFIVLVVLEAVVCVVEAGIYSVLFNIGFGKSIVPSIIANVLSAIMGNMLFVFVLSQILFSIFG